MKLLICIRMYDNQPMETYNLSDIGNAELAGLVENAPEGTLFIFTSGNSNGNSVIMCPGGGLVKTNLEHEGIDFAEWFTKRGITYAILKYRMPHGNPDTLKQDIQLALKLIREKFPEYCKLIGVMGASIGGYLASCSATLLPEDEQPDFQILMYSVVSMCDELVHLPCRNRMFGNSYSSNKMDSYSPLEHIRANTPKAFIVAAADDGVVSPQNSILYAAGLQKAGIPVSLHIYPSGGHGFGYNDSFSYKHEWLVELEKWLLNL